MKSCTLKHKNIICTCARKLLDQAKTYLFVSNDTSALGCRGSRLHQELTQIRVRRKGAAEKAVPLCYKTAYAPIRLEVLAGLLDSDGSYNGAGGFDFISKSSALAEDVAFFAVLWGLLPMSVHPPSAAAILRGVF